MSSSARRPDPPAAVGAVAGAGPGRPARCTGRVRPAGGVRRRLRDHRRRWLALGDALGGGAALATGAVVAVVRLARGTRPAAALAGLLGVAVAVLVALYTGRAVDFFLLQIAANAASALAWTVSIVIRWPLLGLVVATALGQRTRWRRDPDLLRAYRLASWIWVGQYVARLGVFIPLYLVGAVYALGVARLVLTWPLVLLCLAVSWAVLRRALPPVIGPAAPQGGLRRG